MTARRLLSVATFSVFVVCATAGAVSAMTGTYPVAGSGVVELPDHDKAIDAATVAATKVLQKKCDDLMAKGEGDELGTISRTVLQVHAEAGGFLATVSLTSTCTVTLAK